MRHTLEQYHALRKQFDISIERAAIAIGIACGRTIHGSKLERFERGSAPRSGAETNAIIKFYQTLEKGIKPPHIPSANPRGYHLTAEGRAQGLYKPKRQALEELIKPTHVKCDGEFLSTSLAGEGISFFPEGQYLLQVDNKGIRVYTLAKDSNPMAATLERMQADLEKYKKGYESWTALKDLVKD